MEAKEFYENNKNKKWQMPCAPDSKISDTDIVDWLLNESDFGWLELDIEINLAEWQKESSAAKFVKHRGERHPGWNSCCIHGIDIDKTGAWTHYGYSKEEDVPYRWTDLSKHTPNIKKFWETFPYERYRRIRFMELEPGGIINPHSDVPGNLPGEKNLNMIEFGVPINVAVIHPENCHMSLEGYGCIPWAEGKAFIINIRNYHSVINLSDIPRIHVIAHGIPGNKKDQFIELVARSYRKQCEK